MKLPRVAITLGDPAGIGPEVTAKALRAPEVLRVCRPIVIGSLPFLPRHSATYDTIAVPAETSSIRPGEESAAAGQAAYSAVRAAVRLIRQGGAAGLVTAPVSKAALRAAGVRYPGHTELLAALTGTRDYAMAMTAGCLRTVMVTRHLPLCSAGKKLSVPSIVSAARLAWEFLRKNARLPHPRIAVCALNPHAGEGGLLGHEEQEVILPAVRALRRKKIFADGPLPADSAWLKMRRGDYDLLVTMYHDQAMIGLKCLLPEKIVNITLGLPFIRTSPGHGTAFDIAGTGRADPSSMIEAVITAARLSQRR